MKGTMKIALVMLLAAMMVFTISTTVYAGRLNPADIENKVTYEEADTSEIVAKAGRIIALIRNIAVIAGVILLSILGLKYMFGSAEEKAGYQKSFVPLIVGIVVVMSATTIASLIFNMID